MAVVSPAQAKTDAQRIVCTVTRPEAKGGPPPITTYDLIRAALRSRPHGVVIGEACGADVWELIRAITAILQNPHF